jgi:hypothetical protein
MITLEDAASTGSEPKLLTFGRVLAKVKANSMFEPLRFDFRDAILFERWLS